MTDFKQSSGNDSTSDEISKYVHSLKVLERKAEISAAAYLKSIEIVKRKSNIFFIVFLLFSIVLACLSIIIPLLCGGNLNAINIAGLILGFVSVAVSVFSSSDRIFGWGKDIAAYEQGFKTWKSYARDLHWFRKTEVLSLGETEGKLKSDAFELRYSTLLSTLSPNKLSGKEFLELKQELIQTINASKALDSNPYVDIQKFYSK